jgi:hypothetical protein
MNPTPEEKRKLDELLQMIMISGSYDSAVASQEYYSLVQKITNREAGIVEGGQAQNARGAH